MSDASDRGWGRGWPNCSSDAIDQDFNVTGTRFPGGIRTELAELVTRLVQETKNRGYQFGNDSDPSYGCWGYNCRPIGGTNSPSNHSWGLAVDINAPSNPHGDTLITDMPDWMITLWEAYGFRWGGTYTRPDAMHYEFMGTPLDCKHFTEIARDVRLGDTTPPPPELDEEDAMWQYLQDEQAGHLMASNKMHVRWLRTDFDNEHFRANLTRLGLPTEPMIVSREAIRLGEHGVWVGELPPW